MSAFSRPFTFLNNTGIGRFRSANENVRQILCLWYINKNQRSGRKLLNWSCVFSSWLVIFLACTETLFYFPFVLFENIGELASEASAERGVRSTRLKNIERLFFSSPTNTSLTWRSTNPLKKIEGLWTGYYIPDPPRNPGRRNTSCPKSAYVRGCHDLHKITVLFETNPWTFHSVLFWQWNRKKTDGHFHKKKSFVVAQ